MLRRGDTSPLIFTETGGVTLGTRAEESHLALSARYLKTMSTAQAPALLPAFCLIEHRSVMQATGRTLAGQGGIDDVPVRALIRRV